MTSLSISCWIKSGWGCCLSDVVEILECGWVAGMIGRRSSMGAEGGSEGGSGASMAGLVIDCGLGTLIMRDPVVLKLCCDDLLLLEIDRLLETLSFPGVIRLDREKLKAGSDMLLAGVILFRSFMCWEMLKSPQFSKSSGIASGFVLICSLRESGFKHWPTRTRSLGGRSSKRSEKL